MASIPKIYANLKHIKEITSELKTIDYCLNKFFDKVLISITRNTRPEHKRKFLKLFKFLFTEFEMNYFQVAACFALMDKVLEKIEGEYYYSDVVITLKFCIMAIHKMTEDVYFKESDLSKLLSIKNFFEFESQFMEVIAYNPIVEVSEVIEYHLRLNF